MKKKEFTPAYLSLYRKLRSQITEGNYPAGAKLPGKRTIAMETGLSLVTVEHALQILADEGYIESRQRSGYYVCYQEYGLLNTKEEQVSFSYTPGVSKDHFPYSVFARTVRAVLSERSNILLEKSDGMGLPELRTAISDYLARSRNIFVSPEQIVIGSGSEYMYSLIVQLAGRDGLYAVEDPSYEKIARMYRANGAEIEYLKMGNDGIMSAELSRSHADVLHVTPFNSYPSGITATASKRAEYIRWAQERNALIVEDDVDSEFSMSRKPEDTLFSLEPDHTVIYINSFTRTVAPSMRAGYMILPAAMVPVYHEKAGFYSCTVSTLTQCILARLIQSGDFERHINRIRRQKRKNESF